MAPRLAVELPAEPALTPTLQMYSRVTVKQPEEIAAEYEEAGVSRQVDVREETDKPASSSLPPGDVHGQGFSQHEKLADATAEEEVIAKELGELRAFTE
ncbi:hypothetical protein Emag_004041 [Eimeria magna]